MLRIIKLSPLSEGLRKLNRELDRVADKHGIEEPMRFMSTLDDLFDENFLDEDDEEF